MRKHYPTLMPILPNCVTVLALCCGLTSIRMALVEKWELAIFFVVLASVFDFVDGKLARLLYATTKFGAELDSLSDLVCFGVAPAMIVYLFSLHVLARWGWGISMFYTVCLALRLARFNTLIDGGTKWSKKYFVGIPAPGNAYIALTPLCMYLTTDVTWFQSTIINGWFMLMTGALAISRWPFFALKSIQLQKKDIPFYVVIFMILSILLMTDIWLTLAIASVLYLSSAPLSYRLCKKEFPEEWNDSNR